MQTNELNFVQTICEAINNKIRPPTKLIASAVNGKKTLRFISLARAVK